MQLAAFLFAILILLSAIHDGRVSAVKCHVKSKGSAPIADESVVPPPIRNNHLKGSLAHSTDVVPTEEERLGGGISAATRAANVMPITTTPVEADGKEVTMTNYSGDGLVQRLGKWWHNLFSHDEQPTRRLRSQ
ncbi:hypothetical protein PsorP6_006360 [Peronosclerospora sorghi]|uniref:Uncharacterized protein n=1 Tax=Peronosclerospora sorghi TaxID=230839 RepID=A0ACC0W449_9STRA|nr:hypothetical protein PsorP6_006360 [Peronosclerospora sorghi]